MALGVISMEGGYTVWQSMAMTIYLFAGVAQLITLQLLMEDAALWVIVLSGLTVNLRHIIYSASISQHLRPYSRGWKLLMSYLLIDQTYALGIAHYERHPEEPHKQWFYFGIGAMAWITWLMAFLAGFFVGALIPDSWDLNFVIPVMFLGILVPAIKGFPYVAAALVAAAIAVLGVDLPHNLGLVIGIVSGIATGAVLGRDS
jgi:4-azaleucine resistance transporter AzlC